MVFVSFLGLISPLQDPVTWYGINYAGTQITLWDFQNKGKSDWTGKSPFVLEVPLRHLRPSVIYSVPCDWILQRAYCVIFARAIKTDVWQAMVARAIESQKNCSEPPQLQGGRTQFLRALLLMRFSTCTRITKTNMPVRKTLFTFVPECSKDIYVPEHKLLRENCIASCEFYRRLFILS